MASPTPRWSRSARRLRAATWPRRYDARPDELADRFCIAGTPEDIVDRIRSDVLPSGIDHVVLALTNRGLARDWAGLDLRIYRRSKTRSSLIGTRILPELSAQLV